MLGSYLLFSESYKKSNVNILFKRRWLSIRSFSRFLSLYLLLQLKRYFINMRHYWFIYELGYFPIILNFYPNGWIQNRNSTDIWHLLEGWIYHLFADSRKNLFHWCASEIWAYHSKGIRETKVPVEACVCKLSKNCSFYISKFFLNFINLV